VSDGECGIHAAEKAFYFSLLAGRSAQAAAFAVLFASRDRPRCHRHIYGAGSEWKVFGPDQKTRPGRLAVGWAIRVQAVTTGIE